MMPGRRIAGWQGWLPALGALVLLSGFLSTPACGKPSPLTFALPTADWWTAAPFVAPTAVGRLQTQVQNLRILEVASGLASKNAVIAGTADVGLAAATPIALAAANGEPLVVLGTYLRSTGVVGLVRGDGVQDGTVPDQPIAYVPSTISESYLYQFLDQAGPLTPSQRPRLLEQRPPDIPTALGSGAARSAVIWEPFLSIAASRPGMRKDATTLDFEVNLYLLTRKTTYESRSAEIQAFLDGVRESCRWLAEHPDQARSELETRFGFMAGFLQSSFPSVRYALEFDRARAEAEILREARVALERGRIKSVPSLDGLFTETATR